MGVFFYLINLGVVGLFVGALGRLIVPGRNRIGLGATFLIGLSGAILGALIGGLIGLGFISIVFEVAISAGLVYLVSSRWHRRQLPPTTW